MSPRLIVAVAAAVLTYLATWALLFVVCLFGAQEGWTFLPSPNSWTLRAVYLAVAILVGLLTFRHAGREWEKPSLRLAAVPAGLALAAVLVVSGSMHAYGVSREHRYLKHLPPGMSREAGLAYGHQACDWLAAQRWGRAPGPDHLPRARELTASRLVYRPHNVRWHRSNSTDRLTVYYIEHLDAQQPGPLTQNERQQASVTRHRMVRTLPVPTVSPPPRRQWRRQRRLVEAATERCSSNRSGRLRGQPWSRLTTSHRHERP